MFVYLMLTLAGVAVYWAAWVLVCIKLGGCKHWKGLIIPGISSLVLIYIAVFVVTLGCYAPK